MPERDEHADPSNAKASSPRRDDERVPQDPGLDQADTDREQSTTSRPRGHTEEPDRTL